MGEGFSPDPPFFFSSEIMVKKKMRKENGMEKTITKLSFTFPFYFYITRT